MNKTRRVKSSTRIIGYILLFSILTLTTIATIELATFTALSNPKAIPTAAIEIFRRYYRQRDMHVLQLDPDCAHYDPELAYLLTEGECRHKNREFNVHIRSNSLGVRGDEDSLTAPEIILLGDSYSMGWGVEESESFAQLIEARTGLKLLNTGIPSYGTYRQLTLLQRLDTSNLEHLLIQYCENDFQENRTMGEERLLTDADAYARVSLGHKQDQTYYFGKFTLGLSKILSATIQSKIMQRDEEPLLPSTNANQTEDEKQAESFVNVLERFRHLLKGKKITVFETNGYAFNDDGFITALQRELEHRDHLPLDINTVSLTNELSNTKHFFRLDEHLLPSGHQYVADRVSSHLNQQK